MTLVHQKVDIEKSVREGGISLTDLMTLLVQAEQEQATEAAPLAPARKPKGKAVALSEKTKVALRTIPVELANLTLPANPRLLNADEAKAFVGAYVSLKEAAKGLESAENALKETFHNHFDQQAPEGAEIDKKGHAISEGVLSVDGLDEAIIRGVVGGKAAGIKESDLAELEASGDIDHATYLALTVSVPATRTLAPEEKIMAVLQKQPGLVKALAKKARLTDRHTAIRVGKAD